ncbi:MAG: hypothetical protein ACJ8CB_30900 [Ktedonobacteraceae bacterium]
MLQEYRRYRRVAPSKRPRPEQLWANVHERVSKARTVAYEYMNPFVTVAARRSEQGLPRTFPSAEWLLDALATYTPEGKRNAEPTLDHWQQRGLLRRDKPRGMLDLNSVVALLVARIAEEEHQRNWLPSELAEEEPDWWCYSQAGPNVPVRPMPMPLPATLAVTTVLWTPWSGAVWLSEEWSISGNMAWRWAGVISSEQELQVWDRDLATTITSLRTNPLIGQETVQATLVQEASRMILDRIAHRYQTALPASDAFS